MYPGATEVPGDGEDEDCNDTELCYVDFDGDGARGSDTVVSDDLDCRDAGEADDGAAEDCDDSNTSAYPGGIEVVADGIDENCDGAEDCYADADSDGHRTATTVSSADGDCADAGEATATVAAGDCDDADAAIFPGAEEVVADGIDSDCNGGDVCYLDGDADGYRGTNLVASTDADCSDSGEASADLADGDCDNGDSSINPDATELVGDEVDEDCDDGDSSINPDATELVGDEVDEDCEDSGEAAEASDCDDSDAASYPGATEIPDDGVDQDCDGADAIGEPEDSGDEAPAGCGCAASPGTGSLGALGLALAVPQRRRR